MTIFASFWVVVGRSSILPRNTYNGIRKKDEDLRLRNALASYCRQRIGTKHFVNEKNERRSSRAIWRIGGLSLDAKCSCLVGILTEILRACT